MEVGVGFAWASPLARDTSWAGSKLREICRSKSVCNPTVQCAITERRTVHIGICSLFGSGGHFRRRGLVDSRICSTVVAYHRVVSARNY